MSDKIHRDGDIFLISDGNGWLPGCYDSFETATKAHDVKHLENWCFLTRLQYEANIRNGGTEGVITLKDIENNSAQG